MFASSTPTGDRQNDITEVLETAMDSLAGKDRDAILLRFYRSMSLAEVGQAMGITEDAARMRVQRSLEKLRGALQQPGCDDKRHESWCRCPGQSVARSTRAIGNEGNRNGRRRDQRRSNHAGREHRQDDVAGQDETGRCGGGGSDRSGRIGPAGGKCSYPAGSTDQFRSRQSRCDRNAQLRRDRHPAPGLRRGHYSFRHGSAQAHHGDDRAWHLGHE